MLALEWGCLGGPWTMRPAGQQPHRRGNRDRPTGRRWTGMKEEERPAGSSGVCHSLSGWAEGMKPLERGQGPWESTGARRILAPEGVSAVPPSVSSGRAPAGGARAQLLQRGGPGNWLGAGLGESSHRRPVPLLAVCPQQTTRIRRIDFASKHSGPVTSF